MKQIRSKFLHFMNGGSYVISKSTKNLIWRAVLLGFGALAAVCNVASAQSWITQYSGGRNVLGIKAVDENVVWAGATTGACLRSIDDGNTWKNSSVTGALGDFYSVAPIDRDTAYLAGWVPGGGRGSIYKTTDGDQTWTLQYRNTNSVAFFFGIAFWDKDNGIAFGNPVEGSFLIVTTANSGTTWEEVPKANIPPPLAGEFGSLPYGGAGMAVEGSSNAWFGTSQASPDRIFRTKDKGRTWTVANTPFVTGGIGWGISSIAFIDSLNGYAVGSTRIRSSSGLGNLGRTTDGGQTWSVVTSATALAPYNVVYVPGMGDSGLVMTGWTGSYYSQDGGTTWKKFSDEGFAGLTFASPTAGWATRGLFESRIVKFNGNLATAVVERESQTPQAFELAQNYPNPFNPGTRIKFHVPAASLVRLEVFNITAQHIATLLEEKRPAGEHELSWDGRNDLGQPVPSGIYLLSIRAGEFTQTRKMVLAR